MILTVELFTTRKITEQPKSLLSLTNLIKQVTYKESEIGRALDFTETILKAAKIIPQKQLNNANKIMKKNF